LRLAGIYGPGRIPNRADLVAGKPLSSNPEGWLNLIHVDDAVRTVLAAEKFPAELTILNVADGNPARRRDYYQHLAELFSAPEPRFEPPGPDATERARGSADKRISNAKLLAETDVSLQFPSYREGLAAIVQAL
jgi:nucleoside-diphosphate-sugar epimerase